MSWGLLLVACGGGALRSEPLGSVAAAPEVVTTIDWSDLDGLFARGPVALPTALRGLRLGMSASEARAALEAARDPRRPATDEVVSGVTTVDAIVAGFPDVGVSLDLGSDAATLRAVAVTLPRGAAVPMLSEVWGPPDRTAPPEPNRPMATWRGAVLAELYPVDADAAVLHFAPSSE